ncbi:MAG: hypothetical protein FWF51_01385 [Chitinivibrionia bacterium]|nr:hypothetical protein [Chitinivibrionia bacterium]
MRNFTIILSITLVFSCIFIPDEPQKPDGGKFIDLLNLNEILYGTLADFSSFRNYREIFEENDEFFIDANQKSYSSQRFISRLNVITKDATIECRWTTTQSGDELVSMDGTTTRLRARNFRITSQNFSNEITGEVRITVRKTETSGWQITRWEEMDENYSYFHPDFGGNFGN